MIRSFFLDNSDYVAIFHGASFFLLGVASTLLYLRQQAASGAGKRYGLLFLGCFSFFLSLYQVMVIMAYGLMRPGLWHLERDIVLVAGFVLLFESGLMRLRPRARWSLNFFVLLPLVACTVTIGCASKSVAVCEVAIRQFLALPAALLVAFAFWKKADVERPVFSTRTARFVSAIFFLYGFFAGVIVPGSLWGTPYLFTEQRLFAFLGLPAQVLRASFATLLACIFIWRITRSLFAYRASLGLGRRPAFLLPLSFGVLYVAFLVSGWQLVQAVAVHERENVRRLVLKEARLYAEALLVSSDVDVLGLTQKSAYPALRHAHQRMVDLAQQDSFARALYLVRVEEERSVFLVGSRVQIFPSLVFPDFGAQVPTKQILDAFQGRQPTFAGPYADRQGRPFFTVFLPLDRAGAATLYLLALDLDGVKIFREIRRARLFPLFGVMAFLILLIVGYGFLIIFAVTNTELAVQKANLDKAVTHLRETEAQLARSDETFRGILSNSPNAIFGFDRDLRLIFWNEGAHRLYGYESHEVLNEKNPVENRRMVDLMGMEAYEREIVGVFQGQTLVREVAHKTKSGPSVDVVLTVFPVKDPQGNILFGMGLAQDISAHKRLEAALKEERDRLTIIAAHIGAGLSLIDKDFKILWFNEVMQGWFGKLETAQGRLCFDVFHRRQKVCDGCPTEQAFRTGAVSTGVQSVTYPDGRTIDFSIISSPIKDANGVTCQVLELVQDVTERRRLEEEVKRYTESLESLVTERTAALTASELMFRRLFESAQDGILIMDAENGNIIDVNPYLLQLLGTRREEIQGRPFEATRLFRETPALRSISQELSGRFTVFHDDVVLAAASGREINVEVRASWYYVGKRRVIQCHLRDITERRKLERIKTEFVSMVSHELRTPLSAIKEGVEIVADGTQGHLSSSQKECLEIALSNIRRLNRLIGDILDISKIQSNLLMVRRVPCDVTEVVDHVTHLAKIEIEKRGLVLETDIEKKLPRVVADRDRLIQVLVNLLNNAVKFTREKSRIHLTVRRTGNEVMFAVADEGPGIAEEELSRLFGRFIQLDSTLVRRVGGTGLGLYICKNLVDAMGGRIWAESRLGVGSVFKFVLPVEKDASR